MIGGALLPVLLPPSVVATLSFSPLVLTLAVFLFLYLSPGGPSWSLLSAPNRLRGPRGCFAALAGPRPHRLLSRLAHGLRSTDLMAFTTGLTRFVISSEPVTAREILHSPDFADRPLKLSARELLFDRAMGFAPFGAHWRNLRRISAAHFFSPGRIRRFSEHRRQVGLEMAGSVEAAMRRRGEVRVREVLHLGALSSMMRCVFGMKYDFGKGEGGMVEKMVAEGYELLGGFNWGDHVPLLGWLDVGGVRRRCRTLAAEVSVYVGTIIEEHREKRRRSGGEAERTGDFVDVLLELEKGEMALSQPEMIALLWELIFRGTDTVSILLEWILARLVLHPDIQHKAREEIDLVVGRRPVSDADLPNLPYLHAVIKETLRMHPPGPLLSWARLAIRDTTVGGHHVPAGTTAMVNMWSIMHDERNWKNPAAFQPERFLEGGDGEGVGVMGTDLKLAPFGAGKRVCPGKVMGMASVELWAAQMVQGFEWEEGKVGVDLGECLKMSMEMAAPLSCRAIARS